MADATDLIRDWLTRHRAGLAPSHNELFELCEAQLHRLARARLRTFPRVRGCLETADVLNEVLLRLHRALDRGVSPASPLDLIRFCAEVVRRVLLDHLKFIRRHRLDEVRSLDAMRDREQFDPCRGTDHPVDSEVMHGFHNYVDGLGEDDRVLFDLLFYQGLKVSEAAPLLGVPASTLKKRWLAARIRAVERLGCNCTIV